MPGLHGDTPLTPVLRGMDTQAIRDSPPTPVPRPMDIQTTWDAPPIPVLRAMDTRARCPILPTPVPIMGIPWLVIPAIALPRTGRLGPSTLSSPLAEFRPEIHPHSSTPLVA